MAFKCKACGHVQASMSVKCPKCNKIGQMQVAAETVVAPSPAPNLSVPLPAHFSSLTSSLTGSSKSIPSSPVLPRSATPPPSPVQSPVLSSGVQSANLARAFPGDKEIQAKFAKEGLWVRSVQIKNCQCITEPVIAFNAATRDVSGLYCDAWTFAHATISQKFFQLDPLEGKRALALIVDWTKTKAR